MLLGGSGNVVSGTGIGTSLAPLAGFPPLALNPDTLTLSRVKGVRPLKCKEGSPCNGRKSPICGDSEAPFPPEPSWVALALKLSIPQPLGMRG